MESDIILKMSMRVALEHSKYTYLEYISQSDYLRLSPQGCMSEVEVLQSAVQFRVCYVLGDVHRPCRAK